jgi:hypothetical protein
MCWELAAPPLVDTAMCNTLVRVACVALGFLPFGRALAWDYEGHRMVNQLGLASLPSEFPAFVKTPAARERIAFLAGEPDRWRNGDLPLRHGSDPDHYLDMEDLALADLTPADLVEFRQVFATQIAQARAAHPDRFPKIDPEKNKDHTRELVGFLPWAITENFDKLKSGFSYLKAFEELGTPEEIANAQANVIYIMGIMGHFVGDASQPLHTTLHHNGWVGENPSGYTTSNRFHSWVDGGFLGKTGPLSLSKLEQQLKPATQLLATASNTPTGRDHIFAATIVYLTEQHAKLEPLYQMEKAGKLTAEKPEAKEGRAFLENQIVIAGEMLGSLWLTAWREAPPDTFLRSSLLKRKAAETQSTPPTGAR